MRTIHRATRRFFRLSPLFVFMMVLHVLVVPRIYWRWALINWPYAYFHLDHVVVNLRLVQVFVAAYAVWYLLILRRILPVDSGHGLVLSFFGLHAYFLAEFADWVLEFTRHNISLLDITDSRGFVTEETPSIVFQALGGTPYYSLLETVRVLGVVAFVLGFCLVGFSAVPRTRT